MVHHQPLQDNQGEQIVLCPHAAMPWRYVVYVTCWISGVVLGVAIAFAWRGAWLVLPFAGLEVMALVLVMWWVARRDQRMEVIRIDDQRVVVETGYRQPTFCWSSDRFWVRVRVYRPTAKWYPIKILLRSRESEIEIGAFLNEEEKHALLERLRCYLVVI